LRANELKDFKPTGRPAVTKSAVQCAPSRYVSVIGLRTRGFKACAKELLQSKSLASTGLSTVTQFRTAAGARGELAAQIAVFRRRGSRYVALRVRGIPNARGYRLASPGSKGYNVMFADGPFLYLLGGGFHPAAKQQLTRFDVIDAAKSLYRRVHGHPAA